MHWRCLGRVTNNACGGSLQSANAGQSGATQSAFGSSGGFGGSSLFGNAGASTASQFNQSTDVKLDTPYNKLPANMKNAVDELWKQISEQRQLADRLRNVSDADLKKLTGDLRQLKQGLGKAQSIQSGLTVAAEVVHEDAKGLLDATERHGAWPVARMLTPTTGLRTREDMPSPYLRETIEHFTTVLRLYDAQIEALERQLVKHRAAKGSGDAKPAGAIPPHTIAELLRVQQAAFMHVAGSVATIHENVREKEGSAGLSAGKPGNASHPSASRWTRSGLACASARNGTRLLPRTA
eukprot:scaffold3719_cov247-Pinguiococcus_pyrenoidosus.AAC.21